MLFTLIAKLSKEKIWTRVGKFSTLKDAHASRTAYEEKGIEAEVHLTAELDAVHGNKQRFIK